MSPRKGQVSLCPSRPGCPEDFLEAMAPDIGSVVPSSAARLSFGDSSVVAGSPWDSFWCLARRCASSQGLSHLPCSTLGGGWEGRCTGWLVLSPHLDLAGIWA